MSILYVGIDLAKNVFAVHGVNEAGASELRQPKVIRAKLHALIASLPPCVIVMEACSGAHHWVVAAKSSRRLPVVLTTSEVRALLHETTGTTGLVASLLYGTRMRLLEGLRLRVKDVGLERREILVRDGKGGKDRVTVLPENLVLPLQAQIAQARAVHGRDVCAGSGRVWLPDALAVKYPNASRAWGWQWVFPSAVKSTDPRSGVVRRHHLNEASV